MAIKMSLLALPDELIINILKYLPVNDICNILKCDHRLKLLADDGLLWKGLCKRDHPYMLEYYPHLQANKDNINKLVSGYMTWNLEAIDKSYKEKYRFFLFERSVRLVEWKSIIIHIVQHYKDKYPIDEWSLPYDKIMHACYRELLCCNYLRLMYRNGAHDDEDIYFDPQKLKKCFKFVDTLVPHGLSKHELLMLEKYPRTYKAYFVFIAVVEFYHERLFDKIYMLLFKMHPPSGADSARLVLHNHYLLKMNTYLSRANFVQWLENNNMFQIMETDLSTEEKKQIEDIFRVYLHD